MATTFGSWLKQRRKELGIAQQELAERIGCSTAMLWKLESGERQPSIQIANLLADYLHIPDDEREAFIAFARRGQSAVSSARSPGTDTSLPQPTSSLRAPWRTAYRHLTNLPASLTPFIGRGGELVTARDLILDHKTRLLTMVGAPGIGKTRLALQVASDLLDHFEDGVFFVDLAPVLDPLLVLSSIARALGLADEGRSDTPTERLVLNHLRDKRLLLVLDNFEQVLDAAYHLTGLMEGSPWLKILATSREPLRIKGERRFPVPPLSLPQSQSLPSLRELAGYSSVELFIERARTSEPDFALIDRNADVVARICVHLDGLPLGIELAAGQIGFLSPQEIEEGLSERMQLLRAREQHLPERQRTLRGAIDASYNLLDPQLKTVFCQLGIFEGGFTLEAAKAVCGAIAEEQGRYGTDEAEAEAEPASDVTASLRILLDKSLVTQTQTARGARRLGMLETIREYALERLRLSGEAAKTGERHSRYYLSLAQGAATQIRGPEQGRWLNILEAEHDNVNAALEMLFAPRQSPAEVEAEEEKEKELERVETGARLCMALYPFWEMRNYYKEGRSWFEKGIERIDALAEQAESVKEGAPTSKAVDPSIASRLPSDLPALLGTMFSGAGNFAYFQSSFEEALALHEASLAIRRELGDKLGISSSLGNLGNATMDQGDYASAARYHTESLSLARELGSDTRIITGLNNLGIVECDQGNFARARALDEEGLSIAEKLGDPDQVARILNNLGIVMRYQGDFAEARRCLDRALALQVELEMKRNSGHTLTNLGFLTRDQGDNEEARHFFLQGLAAEWEAGDSRVVAECVDGLASIEATTGDAQRAAFLYGCADALREAIRAPVTPAERPYQERYVAQARARLSEAAWDSAWHNGRALSLDEVAQRLLSDR